VDAYLLHGLDGYVAGTSLHPAPWTPTPHPRHRRRHWYADLVLTPQSATSTGASDPASDSYTVTRSHDVDVGGRPDHHCHARVASNKTG